MIEELSLIRLVSDGDWKGASDKLATYPVSLRDSLNYPFYRGLVNFHQKNYPETIAEFEKVLLNQTKTASANIAAIKPTTGASTSPARDEKGRFTKKVAENIAKQLKSK